MDVLGSMLLTWLATIALCAWCGWGISCFLLPPALRPYRIALAPLIGYTVVIWCGYNAVHSVLNLRQALPIMLILAAVANIRALIRLRRQPRSSWKKRLVSLPHPLLLIVAAALLVGVLPLLRYGYIGIIGNGWDSESYLALGTHLQDFRLAAIPSAPASPLRNHVIDPPSLGLSLGYGIVQASVDLLTRQHALQTFAPLLGLMRALGLVAVYVWLRTTMGLQRGPALWATALTAAGALLLWVSYFNFGMQLAAWPLLGLALTLGVAAAEDAALRGRRAWRGVLLAALVWATIPMVYYPLLTVAVPMALGLALAVLVERGRVGDGETKGQRGKKVIFNRLAAMLGIVVLAVPLSTWVTHDYLAGFQYRYANALTTLGLFRFIPLSDILGWTAFHLEAAGGPAPIAVVWVAVIASGGLALAALLRGPQRMRWLLALAGAAVYLVWVRYGRVYHYAYMKGGAYVGFVAAGMLAAGWQALTQYGKRWLQWGSGVAMALLLALAGWSQAQIVRDHWARAAIPAREIAALDRAVDGLIPRDASVLLTSDQRWSGVPMGLIAAALYPRPLRGHAISAYSGVDVVLPGEQPQFALLSAVERLTDLNLPEASLVWHSGDLRLYKLPTEGHPSLLFGRDGSNVGGENRQTGGLLARAWGGPLRVVTPEQPMLLQTGDRLGFGPSSQADTPRSRLVTLELAALEPTTLQIVIGNVNHNLALKPGVQTVALGVQAQGIELHTDRAIALLQARAVDGVQLTPPVVTVDNQHLAWQPTVALNNGVIEVNLRIGHAAQRAVRAELSIVGESYEQSTNALTLVCAPPTNGTLSLSLDLAQDTATARVGTEPQPLLSLAATPAPPDGVYLAVLSILDGEERVARVPLWRTTITQGQVTALEPFGVTIEPARLGPDANERARRDVPLGGQGAQLRLGQLDRSTATPGASLTAQLVWQAGTRPATPPMISVQVLGADDHKWAQWDGPLGGWRPATLWNQGDHIRQDVPLTLDKATPPGRYRVLLLVYDPATNQPLALGGQQGLVLDELEVK